MGRKKLKLDYDPKKIMQELIDITKELYDRKLSYRQIAKELNLLVQMCWEMQSIKFIPGICSEETDFDFFGGVRGCAVSGHPIV